jgi:hypothetical protein
MAALAGVAGIPGPAEATHVQVGMAVMALLKPGDRQLVRLEGGPAMPAFDAFLHGGKY